jgi:hypothetical protein
LDRSLSRTPTWLESRLESRLESWLESWLEVQTRLVSLATPGKARRACPGRLPLQPNYAAAIVVGVTGFGRKTP